MPDEALLHSVKVSNSTRKLNIEKISDGLGFGTGSISRELIETQSGDGVMCIDKAILNPKILVRIDTDTSGHRIEDDGCGDGRQTFEVLQQIDGATVRKARSLNRAKVFGGGATMATATLIGAGRVVGNNLQEAFERGIQLLKEQRIDFGAHTATYLQDPKVDSGCGAIDKAPLIIASAVNFSGQIKVILKSLGVQFNEADYNEVITHFIATAKAAEGLDYAGKAVMDVIIDDGKIVKKLEGSHLETRIVLNFVYGYTVDQKFIRNATGAEADVFAVDVWRIQELAEKLYPDNSQAIRQAVLSELVYTLATAAVLTKGDLPVYTVRYDKAEE